MYNVPGINQNSLICLSVILATIASTSLSKRLHVSNISGLRWAKYLRWLCRICRINSANSSNVIFPGFSICGAFSSSMYILSILKLKSLYVAKTNVRACCLVNSDAPNRGCCAKCIVQSALSTWRRRSTMSVSIPGTNSRQSLCICVFARSFPPFSGLSLPATSIRFAIS